MVSMMNEDTTNPINELQNFHYPDDDNNLYIKTVKSFLVAYPDAILTGAFAITLGKYTRELEDSRGTSYVDFILSSKDFYFLISLIGILNSCLLYYLY